MDRETWNRRYEGSELLWTGEANRFLAAEAAGLDPGRALDLACGEGRNAVWLAERGFRVTVYERDHLGGKAWSVGVPGSASGGRSPLPAEHGFRFFPGFYCDERRLLQWERGLTSTTAARPCCATRTCTRGSSTPR